MLTLDPAVVTTFYSRHALAIRILHWINAITFFVLFMSGLQIFNAHPALDWGKSSYTGRPPLLAIGTQEAAAGGLRGTTTLFGHEFTTTGVLGASRDPDGQLAARAFPAWVTVPSSRWLAMARRWHLSFAWVLVLNGLAYLLYSLVTRHLSRDLTPTRQDWRGIGRSLRDHLLLRHPQGAAAARYNVLQKLAYLSVVFGLLPLIMLTGWAMSPWLDSVSAGWVDFFGGRQAARTIHFFTAWALVAFVLIHVFEVIVTGFWNNLRSMITGRYRIQTKEGQHDAE